MLTEIHYPPNALANLEAGRIDEACSVLETELAADPNNASVLDLLGVALLRSGKALESLEVLRKAISQPHKHPVFFHHHAELCSLLQYRAEAIQSYTSALRFRPDAVEYGLPLARLLVESKQHEDAVKVLRALLQFHPGNMEVFNVLRDTIRQLDLEAQREPFRNHQSILFAAIGHSAGTFICAELSRRLGMLDHRDPITDQYGGNRAPIIPKLLERFLHYGGILHAHMFPCKRSILALNLSGIRKVNVHLRDPRQAFYSSILYVEEALRTMAQRTPEMQRYEMAMLECNFPEGYFRKTLAEKLDAAIEFYLGVEIEWIQGWLDAEADPSRSFEIQWTKFEDFKSRPEDFFRSIVDFHGIPRSEFRGEPYECKPGDYAFRKGVNDEWRSAFSESQKARIRSIATPELMERLGYSPE
ncbi:MAG: hypothetical protein U0136_15085 [Bdellovibrionota bacterium]